VKYYVAMFATLALVVAATVGAYQVWDNATHTRDDSPGLEGAGGPASTVPSTGQVLVSGRVDAAHLEGVVLGPLALPVTITTSDRGVGGATFTPVEVDGASTSIDWQAGQPLPISGDGQLVLGPVVVDATADGITIVLDGVHSFAPGDYTLGTSVAVGSTPRDRVTFTATDKSTVEFRGGANTPFPGTELVVDGTGPVTLQGTLTTTKPDGSTATVPSVTLDQGQYHVTLTPAPEGGFNVQATLQGNVR
jgi:hypothetical protein